MIEQQWHIKCSGPVNQISLIYSVSAGKRNKKIIIVPTGVHAPQRTRVWGELKTPAFFRAQTIYIYLYKGRDGDGIIQAICTEPHV